ncbi:hypothetical protein BDY21DRAFT_192827 [Lineolata rhizophorae]|uniref:Uncharacterized protein n=1 Tax=Lineolata rhizophorae TaxID=578093 RepID=A0A6A6P6F5_9PEZI|nr:hypothetical protein BDY21DRAFT_192827 [Lineolata rhizophorae]
MHSKRERGRCGCLHRTAGHSTWVVSGWWRWWWWWWTDGKPAEGGTQGQQRGVERPARGGRDGGGACRAGGRGALSQHLPPVDCWWLPDLGGAGSFHGAGRRSSPGRRPPICRAYAPGAHAAAERVSSRGAPEHGRRSDRSMAGRRRATGGSSANPNPSS